MGDPVNKAAFTLVATIAAVMAGGMVPPLGIAIATTLFKNKFSKDEREAGKVCYIMGLSFITEGAILFKNKFIIKEKTNRLSASWSFFIFCRNIIKG